MKVLKGLFVLLGILLIIEFSSAVVFYDQGTGVINSTNDTLALGNLTILIYDNLSLGNLIFNESYINNITNGSWNVKITTTLEYGKSYFKDYIINDDNINFSGVDRVEFQSPYGVINNASFINFSLIETCASGSSIRQIYSNGSVVCETDNSASVNLSNYALTNESVVFSENITTTSYGFFGWLGSLTSRITSLFVVNINASGNIDAVNYTLNGTTISSWDEVNLSTFNKTYADTLYYGIINPSTFWNDTYATFNKTYADTLYSGIGNISYISKWTNSLFNGSLYTTGTDPTLSDSNSLFQVIGSDGTPRFQIQNGGSSQASFIARSFMVVNQNDTRLNQSQNNLCNEWGFLHIDCNSSSTGADMGVQDDFEVQGVSFAMQGLYAESADWGAYSFMGDLAELDSGLNGSFTDSNNYFCDNVSTPFLQSNADENNWIKVNSGTYEGALAEIIVYLNSSCVEVNNNPAWNESISNIDFRIITTPVLAVLDGGSAKFNIGESIESKFKIDVKNGTMPHGFELSSIAGSDQFMAARLYTDIKTHKGVTSFESVIDSSVSTGQTNSNNMILQLVSTNINAGTHAFMKAFVVGTKSDNLFVNLIEASGNFSSYIKQGEADIISKVYYDNGNGSNINVDITAAILNSSNNVALFENDDSYVYLGSSTNFTKFSVSLATTASQDLNFEIYYCNTTGGWPIRAGVTDTTNGFTESGFISVEQASDDRGVCNFDIDGDPFANETNYTYVALKRTRNAVSRVPIEEIGSISGSSSTFILADEYIKLSGVSAPPITCDPTSDGTIYYDTDVKFHCSCNTTAWVQMNDYTTVCS